MNSKDTGVKFPDTFKNIPTLSSLTAKLGVLPGSHVHKKKREHSHVLQISYCFFGRRFFGVIYTSSGPLFWTPRVKKILRE